MKTRKKGGVIALFIFLIIFIAVGAIIYFSYRNKNPINPASETLAEEYSPEEINIEKIVLENGRTYFSFRGVYEKYADFIETELEKEGIIFSEIESPDDYSEILEPEEFERITETVEILEEIEGEWIEADEEEILNFISQDFPAFRKEEVKKFSKELLSGTKIVQKEEIEEYIILDDLAERLRDVD